MPVGLTPGCDVRELIDRRLGEQGLGMVLGGSDEVICGIVTPSRSQVRRKAINNK